MRKRGEAHPPTVGGGHWGELPPERSGNPRRFLAWAETFARRVPDGLGSRVYREIASALRHAATALDRRALDAEIAEKHAAGHWDRGVLALAPTLLNDIMARDGVDLPTAAQTLAAQLRWSISAESLAFNWETARLRARKLAKRERAALVMSLAAQGLANRQIAEHPGVVAANAGLPLHPDSVSRILQRNLRRKPPAALPGADLPKPVRHLMAPPAPAPLPHRPHTPAVGPARAPAPPAERGLFSSPPPPAIAAE